MMTHLFRAGLLAAPLAALLLGSGCNRKPSVESRTGPLAPPPSAPLLGQGGGPPETSFDARFDGVVEAQCDHELRCGHVGTGKKFASRNACVTDARATRMTELATLECGRGIDAKHMSDCMAAIRDGKCDDPFDDVAREEACRSVMLCLPEKVVP